MINRASVARFVFSEVFVGSRALKGRHNIKKKDKKVIAFGVLGVVAALGLALCIGFTSIAHAALADLPDYSNASSYNNKEADVTTFYASDRTTVLAELQLEWREPVTIDQVSQYVLDGTVATEDERFYQHNGVDPMGIARAVVNNLAGGALEGASTITQQFVRNTILSEEMTDISFNRKIREMYIALKLEEQHSKDEILNMYLNTINYGSGAYGIEAASQRYFSKHANELTLSEAATLVGIPQSPTYNNPVDNPDNCLARRNVVLDRMVSNGKITQEEAAAAKAEPIVLNETQRSVSGIKAYPYFTDYVKNQLEDAEGKYRYTRDDLFKGGLKVYTTLDVEVQQAAEEAAEAKLAQVGEPFEIALAAIDPDNGYVRAMIGGKNFEETQVNMATGDGGSGRQPGSSAKTFTLVTALEEGIDPETTIDAGATVTFPGWNVENINKHDYGTKTIADAFAVSSNTAFARLIMYLTPEKVNATAHKLGIKSDLKNVGAATLGSEAVNPLEMADAYATIANGGIHYEPECIEEVVNRDGEVVVDNSHPEGERVISEEVAYAATEVMKGVINKPIGTGGPARLANGQEAAGKTGTSENYMDSWFCGITPQYSVAIWMGDRSPISVGKPIIPTVTSVFSGFLNKVLADQPKEYFPKAKAPKYKENFENEEYHIGGKYNEEEEFLRDEEGNLILDEDGNPIPVQYERDEEGNLILDEEGNPIPIPNSSLASSASSSASSSSSSAYENNLYQGPIGNYGSTGSTGYWRDGVYYFNQ